MAPDRFDEHPARPDRPAPRIPPDPLGPTPPPARGGRAIYILGFILLIAAAAGWFALRASRSAALEETRQALAHDAARGPLVQTAIVTSGNGMRQVTLLGDARPYQVATLFAKTSGYLERITVDKGDRVKAGQIIAQITSPELDHQYAGALADLRNKRVTLKRAQILVRTRDVPQQTLDNAQRDVTVAEATASQLASLKNYQIVRAPFDGVVTARFADPGALVQSAETNQQNALGLIRLADNSRLRVYVHVAQTEAPFVRVGQKAVVADAANPALKVDATVARTSGALDDETRTLLTEVDIAGTGQGYRPLPGSFVYVTLDIPVQALPSVPATALILRDGHSSVAVVDTDGHIHMIPVQVVQTDGRNTQINGEVTAGQRIALNLPLGVRDGDVVRPAPDEDAATAPAAKK